MARLLEFFDGVTTDTPPTLGNLIASDLSVYTDDASYEVAEAGSPVEGNLYFNSTLKRIRYYNGTEWRTVPKDAIELDYDNASSGLSADNTQDAIDEVEARVDQNESNISDNALDILDLETLSGSPGATDHGTFTGSTIPDNSTTKDALQSLETEVEQKIGSSEKGAANGVATLDAGGKLPTSQLPTTAMEFKGSFDPTGPTPNLQDGSGDLGDFYRVSVAGSHDFGSGSIDFDIGDSVIYNGSIWEKYDEQPLADTDSLPEGSSNLYYTDTRADARIAAASIDDLSDVDTSSTPPVEGQALLWNSVNSEWEPGNVSSVGSGDGLNYLEGDNSTAETTIGDWVTYNDGASSSPVDGENGTTNITLNRTTIGSEILRGSASFKLSKDAANRQGEGVSIPFTIDPKDKGQEIIFKLDFKTTANYVSGDIVGYIYDVTNGSLIGVLGNDNNGEFFAHTGEGATFIGQFTSALDSTSYRLILHIASTNALAYDFIFVRGRLGPDDLLIGDADTDWEAFTPDGSWVSGNEVYTGKWRKEGPDFLGQYRVELSNPPTSTVLDLNLPNLPGYGQLTIDTNSIEIGDSVTRGDSPSSGIARDFSDSQSFALVARYLGNDTAFRVGVWRHSADANYVDEQSLDHDTPFVFTNNDFIIINVKIPVTQFKTSSQLSSTSLSRLNPKAIVARDTTTQNISSAAVTTVIFDLELQDTHNSYNPSTGEFTMPRDGDLKVDYSLRIQNHNGEFNDIGIYVNGSKVSNYAFFFDSNLRQPTYSTIIPNLRKGDVVGIGVDSQTDTSYDIIGNAIGTHTRASFEVLNDLKVLGMPGRSLPQSFISANFRLDTAGYASTEYAQMTGNSFTLGAGLWVLSPMMVMTDNGANGAYNIVRLLIAEENGDNTGTVPSSIINHPNYISHHGQSSYLWSPLDNGSNAGTRQNNYVGHLFFLELAGPAEVFVVGYSEFSAAADAGMQAYCTAFKLR